MEVEPQPSGVPNGWQIVTTQAAAPPPPASDHPPTVVSAGGRGTQLDVRKSMRGLELATTPLARPTGIDAIDGFTSPLGLASLAAGGVGIARAGVTGGAAAGAKEALALAAPTVKYEAAKTLLEKMGVPSPLAAVAAAAISGYKKGAKTAPPVAEPIPEPHVPANATGTAWTVQAPPVRPASAAPVAPVASGPAAPAPPAVAAVETAGPPRTSGSPPSAPRAMDGGPVTPTKSPQQLLNEEALGRRRADYQARVAAEAKAAGLLPADAPEYMKLIKAGKSHAEAVKTIQTARQLQQQLGALSPADVESEIANRIDNRSPKR